MVIIGTPLFSLRRRRRAAPRRYRIYSPAPLNGGDDV
jgi:hypothetical protein